MESFFTFLNTGALLGWSIVLTILILHQKIPILSTSTINEWVDPFFDVSSNGRIPLIDLLFFLEALCCIEVTRIAIGQLKGNLILGIVLHMIRITCLLLVLPNGLTSSTSGDHNGDNINMYNNPKFFTSILVLYSWSLTEVGRYPMYLFPTSNIARNVRLVLPMITFPIGCAAEAYGAYTVLIELLTMSDDGNNSDNVLYWVKITSLVMVLLINGLLGPTMAYPALLKKGMRVVMGNKSKKQKEKKNA